MLFLVSLLLMNQSFAESKCSSNEHWVRAHHRRAYTRYDGTFVSATNVRAHCQGNPPGYEYWRPRLSDERPLNWDYKIEKSKKWTPEEIERTIEALSNVPKILWEKSGIKFL